MGCLGNIIWIICGGIWQALAWLVMGILWCVTIAGIPIGLQCFKFASLAFAPFGKDIQYGGGAGNGGSGGNITAISIGNGAGIGGGGGLTSGGTLDMDGKPAAVYVIRRVMSRGKLKLKVKFL